VFPIPRPLCIDSTRTNMAGGSSEDPTTPTGTSRPPRAPPPPPPPPPPYIHHPALANGTMKRARAWPDPLSLSQTISSQNPNLDEVAATLYPGRMGIPQELVGRIMEILQDDIVTLTACSLTCKSIYASTRHLIHQTFYLTDETIQRVGTTGRTAQQQILYRSGEHLSAEFWHSMINSGFLRYARRVYIKTWNSAALIPYLNRLDTLDGVHTLTISSTDICRFISFKHPQFSHLNATLTTLSIHFPQNPHKFIPSLIAQFPNLENLTLELFLSGGEEWGRRYSPRDFPTHSPPLRGHLRCSGVSKYDCMLVRALVWGLPDGINFRSVELRKVHWRPCLQLLGGCKDTLEEFILTVEGNGTQVYTLQTESYSFPAPIGRSGATELGCLALGQNSALRRFVVRATFVQLIKISLRDLRNVLKTIRSPVFSEFALELGTPRVASMSNNRPQIRGDWMGIDKWLARCRGVRLIIRTDGMYGNDTFREKAMDDFPLMAKSGRVSFEICSSVNEHWN